MCLWVFIFLLAGRLWDYQNLHFIPTLESLDFWLLLSYIGLTWFKIFFNFQFGIKVSKVINVKLRRHTVLFFNFETEVIAYFWLKGKKEQKATLDVYYFYTLFISVWPFWCVCVCLHCFLFHFLMTCTPYLSSVLYRNRRLWQ